MSLTIEELSKLLNIRLTRLQSFVFYDKNSLYFFEKKYVDDYYRYKNKAKKRKRMMWVLKDKELENFKRFWSTKKGRGRPKLNEPITSYIRKYWTAWARDCYEVKCNCKSCIHDVDCSRIEKYEHKRHMKQTVIELVKECGIPPERIIEE